MRRFPLVTLILAVALVGAACGDDVDVPPGETTIPNGEAGTGDPVATEDESTVEAGPPLFEGLDGTVTLLTPEEGVGMRPLLSWEPVSGADHYTVYLYAPSGGVYWTWTGHGTEVHVGGEPRLRDDASGPSIVDGMSWAVMAHDAAGLPVAVSEGRPIAP